MTSTRSSLLSAELNIHSVLKCFQKIFKWRSASKIISAGLNYINFSDDKLIHLDPHYCQEVVDVWQPNFPLWSFHCRSPRKMNLSRLDPSCCIGFYCRTRDDFFKFMKSVQQVRKHILCQFPSVPLLVWKPQHKVFLVHPWAVLHVCFVMLENFISNVFINFYNFFSVRRKTVFCFKEYFFRTLWCRELLIWSPSSLHLWFQIIPRTDIM